MREHEDITVTRRIIHEIPCFVKDFDKQIYGNSVVRAGVCREESMEKDTKIRKK